MNTSYVHDIMYRQEKQGIILYTSCNLLCVMKEEAMAAHIQTAYINKL